MDGVITKEGIEEENMRKKISMVTIFIIFSVLPAWGFTISPSTSRASKTISSVHTKRVNIVVSKIDQGYIYDNVGNKYKIPSHTRIIDNRLKNKHKVTIAELVFEDGRLKCIILKGGK